MSSTVIVTSVALTFGRGIIVINEIVRSYITAMISPAEPSKILKNHGHRLSNENCRHCYYSPQTSQPRGQQRGSLVPKVSLLMVDPNVRVISERFRQFYFFTKRSTLLVKNGRKAKFLHSFSVEQNAKLLQVL